MGRLYIYTFIIIYHKNQPFMLVNIPFLPWMVWGSMLSFRAQEIASGFPRIAEAKSDLDVGVGPQWASQVASCILAVRVCSIAVLQDIKLYVTYMWICEHFWKKIVVSLMLFNQIYYWGGAGRGVVPPILPQLYGSRSKGLQGWVPTALSNRGVCVCVFFVSRLDILCL